MLKTAFNALTRLHSKPAMLKRLGPVVKFSPVRLTPSNYFRFLAGPEYTKIPGYEFVIPVDSILGEFAQRISFVSAPTVGVFRIKFGANSTTDLAYNVSAADMQIAIRLLPGMNNALVTGNFSTGFIITFAGQDSAPALGQITNSTLDIAGTFSHTFSPWGDLKKGDRLVMGSTNLAIDEIIFMYDLGASVMGYRVRCD